MKFKTLCAALICASLAMLAACASTEDRDTREDIHNTMKHDAVACGTDTACLQRRQKSHSSTAPAPAASSAP